MNGSFPPGTHLKFAYFPVGFRREGDVGFVNTACLIATRAATYRSDDV